MEPCLQAPVMNVSHRTRALARSEQGIINFVLLHQTDTTDRQFTLVVTNSILYII